MSRPLSKEIVDRIVEEVLYRLKEMEPKGVIPAGTAVLVTSFIPSFHKADALIRGRFGDDITYIDFGGSEFPSKLEQVVSAEELGTDKVLSLVNGSANIVLLTPRLKMIENIAHGRDESFVEFLVVRSLLWGRQVSAVLDFTPPSFKRNTFFERIIGELDGLRDIGIELISYDCSYEKTDEKSLITETDVVEAWKKGQEEVRSATGGIITPSAKDKAKELGVAIN